VFESLALCGIERLEISGGRCPIRFAQFGDVSPCRAGPLWLPGVLVEPLARGEGNRPILIYQVENLNTSAATLQARGWVPESGPFEIRNGPCFRFHDPMGTRLAIYENQRPGVDQKFAGRFDTE
jgi:hypothetical protein